MNDNSALYAFNKFCDTVLRTAFAMTGNYTEAEDITQEVFLALHARPQDFENCRQLCKSLQSFAVYSRLFPIFGALQALKIQTYENTGNAKNEKEVDLVEVW